MAHLDEKFGGGSRFSRPFARLVIDRRTQVVATEKYQYLQYIWATICQTRSEYLSFS